MKQIFNFLATAAFCCTMMFVLASCQGLIDAVVGTNDNPASQQPTASTDQLKQGVWTEFDIPLEASDNQSKEKYSEEELEYEVSDDDSDEELDDVPSLGMLIDGNKAYFFTYSAEGADNLVEGTVSYNKAAGTGSITFPTITGSPLSGQTVNFTATSDETLEFEYTYGDKKLTAGCTWLCESLDNWDTEGEESDWEELLTYYQNIEDAGPDPSIDWSASEVKGLDQPLVWEEPTAATRGNTRMVGAIVQGVSAGLEIFSSLFEDDPNEVINQKLDAITGKLDKVLANQNEIKEKINNINQRLITIADMMKQKETVEKFTYRDEQYYNQLKLQDYYFNEAYSLYKKGNLTNENKNRLGDLAKKWAGDNKTYINKTWLYIDYITTVAHSVYKTKGMDQIYDRLTFDKYPWEHQGIGDRQCYRAYDLFMITKCLFMISLYYNYGGLDNDDKNNLDSQFQTYNPPLKRFCNFKVADPNKFRVCQIPGAHFIMHKELQKYNYCGPDNKCPHPGLYGGYDALYRPEWHQAGSVKIDNPKELKSKLISVNEAYAIYDYYKAIYKQENIHWADMLVEHLIDKKNVAGGADYALAPKPNNEALTFLMLHDTGSWANGVNFVDGGKSLGICPVVSNSWRLGTSVIPAVRGTWYYMGTIYMPIETLLRPEGKGKWKQYNEKQEYYGAIVEKRYTPTK
jgi:hypothetical protein